MSLNQINWPIVGIALSGAFILLLRDWRVTFPALLCSYVFVAMFVAQQQFITPDLHLGSVAVSTMVLVKLITGAAATAILAITALTFSREYNLEDLDEFSLAELRRAARRAQRQRAVEPFRLSNYVVAFWALVLAALASLSLPRLYPIGQSYAIDFAWYWLGLTGLFTLVTAADLLKIGLGLLLCAESVDLLYTAISSTVQVFPLALLSLMTIVLALAIAYLSGLLYGRLKTLELNELYKR
jgi:multisubunit Na+/H+ antiporter MnhC subunit